MAQHMRVHRHQLGPPSGHSDEVIHGLPCEGLLALGQEKPRERIGPSAEIALEGSELVTGDRVLDGQPILEPLDPEPRVVEVDFVTAEADRLADTQTVTKHHEDQEMIPDPVPSGLGGVEQGSDFGFTQKILTPLMGVSRGRCVTFYISPVGW
nr:hypothetical protein [Rhodopila globiformis]